MMKEQTGNGVNFMEVDGNKNFGDDYSVANTDVKL